ncbi:hypothetical protein GCM10009645_42800 [Mycolicibacterium poriferae]|uniref:Glucanase n=1 Tax=Mycolicibacterium poriferae TaxID=39694 RepID=A0A6N4VA19_9MYCO|nr:glycoside hydrolase family 6 protein [Mycolicibacterium poriferae]MCV7263604.1 glycoside hydrolase family 6 protein [Mycolicibacterium poriferae]BBX50950.1 hypothetical protein MPOR_19760 [Mycolicibacterium poriferae]
MAAVVVAVLASVVVISYSGWWNPSNTESLAGRDPANAELYIDPDMQSIAAAREDARFDPIATTPQAKWFTDWSTSETVQDDVGDYLDGAAAADAVPTVVLYRIPQRDCGSWSTGGAADEQEYRDWVKGAAAELKGHDDALVIIEPDALPQLGKCEQGDRLDTLTFAVDALATTGARVYIDAGHENWLSAAEAADRLSKVGVDKVRGFSLNVAAHYTTQREIAYAEDVRSELSKLGITDVHYVIDTGRNGAGPQGDNCNPPGARLGHEPQLFEGDALDGFLWVKNPGETDGACRGGPASGFWAPAALDLLGLDQDERTSSQLSAGWIRLGAVGGAGLVGLVAWALARRRTRDRLRGAAEHAARQVP